MLYPVTMKADRRQVTERKASKISKTVSIARTLILNIAGVDGTVSRQSLGPSIKCRHRWELPVESLWLD